MTTMQEIRACYPHPVTGDGHSDVTYTDECYCVGGSVVMYVNNQHEYYGRPQTVAEFADSSRFPDRRELAAYLRELNPRLGTTQAWYYADTIIEENDGREYDAAWCELDRALTDPGVSE